MEQGIKDTSALPYKFKELRIYSSTEWLSGNKKKYRQVYDAFETGYIYAELSFVNKLYDVESWQVHIELRCYELTHSAKQLCHLNFKRKVSKHDHIMYIREGWGNKKPGMFWKKGTYYWEAYVDGDLVSTKYFYVIDSMEVPNQKLLELQSIKLYEGQYDDVNEDDRVYLKRFSSEETRYIYLELLFNNLFQESDWQSEIFARFYNETYELKGQVTRLRKLRKNETTLQVSVGWGSNVKGSWKPGDYRVEILFLGRFLARAKFTIDEEFEEGQAKIEFAEDPLHVQLNPSDNNHETFEQILYRLDQLVGLEQIKQQVRDHAKYIQFLQLRKSKGFKEEETINVHSVFTGNPGTGKTTVARLLGILYKKMGLLSKGHIHEVDRADLVGEYIGQTAPKVKENIEKARGGVLFIDEAYALARSNDDSKDFGREVIEILVKEMSNGPGDMAVIVAGYPKEMQHFIDSNPGLQSRFKHFFEFRDYLPQELSKIGILACQKKEVLLDDPAKFLIDEIIIDAYRSRDRNFGNARFVYDLIEKAKINMGLRLMNEGNSEAMQRDKLMQILIQDVESIQTKRIPELPSIPIDNKMLKVALRELNSLIGIQNVKKEIHELVDIVRFHKRNGNHVLNNYFLHTTFIGNPGTGKTTVARILTKIYKALGILERGHMVETDRQGLVAGFVGQTAIKTAERIDEAMGGVLFIDEAYALSNFNGLQGDYGNEAIQTILKRMEDHRGKFFVFAAGYPENMERFLKANPGLNSRFDKQLIFHDYEPAELNAIADKMLADNNYRCTKVATEEMYTYLERTYAKRDKFFGNARTIRSIILDLIKIQNLRLAHTPNSQNNHVISVDDVRQLVKDRDNAIPLKQSSIGFKR